MAGDRVRPLTGRIERNHEPRFAAGVESREERSDRLFREHTEQQLVDSADLATQQQLDGDAADRRWREANPLKPTDAMPAEAQEYQARVMANPITMALAKGKS